MAVSASWFYAAAAAGVTNTATAVTIKTAAATTGDCHYIEAVQMTADPLGAATEFAIRDGAAGAVLWRIKIPLLGFTSGVKFNFARPLKGSPNTLLEIVTLTASVTGAVHFNAQGFTSP